MAKFRISSIFKPTGDQPQAIEKLVKGLNSGQEHQVLLGVTGSGKSVTGDTPVLIKHENGLISNEFVGDFIDKIFKLFKEKTIFINEETETILAQDLPSTYQVSAYSLNPKDKMHSWKPIKQFIRHLSPKTLYRVQTKCGREITVTGDHNFWVFREGKLQLLQTKALKGTDFIPIPNNLPGINKDLDEISLLELFQGRPIMADAQRYINRVLGTIPRLKIIELLSNIYVYPEHKYQKIINGICSSLSYSNLLNLSLHLNRPLLKTDINRITLGSNIQKYSTPANFKLTDNFLRLLGYYIAEGHSEVDSRFFTISNNEPEVIDDLLNIFRIYNLDFYHRNYDYSVSSKIFTHLFSILCGHNSYSKKLPKFWPNLSNRQLAMLLKAYFEGDGGVWLHRGVVTVSASQQLISNLGYALLKFGIWTRVYKQWQSAKNSKHKGAYYWYLTISGRENIRKFAMNIGFISKRKNEALQKVFLKCKKTQVDVIPDGDKLLKVYRQKLGLSQYQLSKMVKISYQTLFQIEKGKYNLQRWVLKSILDETTPLATGDIRKELESLLHCYWTSLKSTEKVNSQDKFVYDFSVQDNETFLAGYGGIFVHNTFTMANVIQAVQKPTLLIVQNKTLAGQLAQEFRSIFPKNAVEYFVSYYDYYQPEAYIAQSDTYIEKETEINEEIEKLRLSATTSLMTRKDVVVVASVSCIYNLGNPVEYQGAILEIKNGVRIGFQSIMKMLTKMFYSRNDIDFKRSTYRVKGDTIDIFPGYADQAVRIELLGDKIERVSHLDPLTGSVTPTPQTVSIYPAKHYITPEQRLKPALIQIERDLGIRLEELRKQDKLIEAQRLEQRTRYDLEMIQEFGYCNGIENYSRYFEGRKPGDPPYTLMEYFSKDFLLIIDESHITLPQIRGMYNGDRSRKENLIEFGFRLPSALDNRPLKFDEFQRRINQVVYVSATPDEYELSLAGPENVAEQLVRPTGIVDPVIYVRPTTGQIEDVLYEIEQRVAKHERVLITTLTKRMAEDLTDYLKERNIKVNYLHSDIETLKRADILQSLRLGEYDVIVGINLLREGLDLPEVTLVIILDADKEGFLRSRTSLIQTMGRAARNIGGEVIMYADNMTKSMKAAIDEVERRREYQLEYNKKNHITPKTIEKALRERLIEKVEELEETLGKQDLKVEDIPLKERDKMIKLLDAQMKQAAELLDFEEAAKLRDQIKELSI